VSESQQVQAEPRPEPEQQAERPILEVRDLCKTWAVRGGALARARGKQEEGVAACKSVSFSIRRGEVLALVGESGSGKTTTAHCVLGLERPDSGSVLLDGEDLLALKGRELARRRRRVQMVYQDPYEALDPRQRVYHVVEEPLRIHRIGGSAAERRELVTAALEEVELAPAVKYMRRYPHELSGGQRQRVAIAAGLILGPDLLVADEPVSMLDVSVRAGVLAALANLRRTRKLALLMITHDLSTVAHAADRIAVMYKGEIVETGPAREVLRNPQHEYTQALVAAVPRLPRAQRQPGVSELKGGAGR
jgi:peptide/nickel transport system ATP-binding protein